MQGNGITSPNSQLSTRSMVNPCWPQYGNTMTSTPARSWQHGSSPSQCKGALGRGVDLSFFGYSNLGGGVDVSFSFGYGKLVSSQVCQASQQCRREGGTACRCSPPPGNGLSLSADVSSVLYKQDLTQRQQLRMCFKPASCQACCACTWNCTGAARQKGPASSPHCI